MIKYNIAGAAAVRRFFATAPEIVRKGLKTEIDRLGILLLAKMKQKVSGEVLNVRTGRLRRSLTMKKNDKGANGYTVTVGTNLKYAAVHEYGFDGEQSVKQHMREIRQAFGRPLTNPKQYVISAHTRRVRFPERSFARSSFEEMKPYISQQLSSYLQIALQNARNAGGSTP